MKPTENIERLVQSVRVKTSPAVDDRILTDSLEALAKARHQPPAAGPSIFKLRRFLMQSRYAKYATAAAIVVAVAFASWIVLNNGASTAYAFTQTVQAMHSVRSLHMKFTGGQLAESWSEFDPAGEVIRCRMDFPKTEDGHKVVFWRDNKASVWFKTKNSYLTIADQKVAQRTYAMACDNDPKLMVSRLQEAQAEGKVEIQTQPSAAAGQPIVLTVTYLPTSSKPDRREILSIDPVTKLVTQVEVCRKTDDQYQPIGRFEILDYNQPIDPAVFDPELPADIMRIDQTTQQVGLAQGTMTDHQVAQEVVRQFFQALIDKDYAKAGTLLGGFPAAKLEEKLGKLHVLRIVSIGEPTPRPESQSLRVPVTLEIEKDGKVEQWSPFGPFVRQVESDRTRWQIIGGI